MEMEDDVPLSSAYRFFLRRSDPNVLSELLSKSDNVFVVRLLITLFV